MALTRRQREVLDVIRDFIARNGYSPSLEEIGGALGLSSVATVHKHVTHLVQKGYVRRGQNQNRSVEIADRAEGAQVVGVPVIGTIAAGAPVEAVPSADSLPVPTEVIGERKASFALRVKGDSFFDEHLRDGDLLVVEERDLARDGETVVAVVDGAGSALGRFYREGRVARLLSSSPGRNALELEAGRLHVQGVVIALIRRY